MKIPGFASERTTCRYVGGIAVDGDQATIVVCDRAGANRGTLRFDRDTLAGDAAMAMREAEELVAFEERGSRIQWVQALAGGDVIHEVVSTPPQVRAFHEVRLDACVAGTNWGSVDAIEAAGNRLGSMFDRDRCIIGVAPADAISRAIEESEREVLVTSAAVALLELFRRVEPGYFELGARPALAMLCEGSRIASCAVDSGEVRLLHQIGLVEYFREYAPGPATPQAPDGPLEYEFGASYSYRNERQSTEPRAGGVRREGDAISAEVESGAYQASVMKIVQEILTLFREQYGPNVSLPETIFITGEAASRHAVQAFLTRYLGSQFDIRELDAALVVRIDDPEVARRFASLQGVYSAALAAVAAGMRSDVLEIPSSGAGESIRPAHLGQIARRSSIPTNSLLGLLVALTVVGVGAGVRYGFVARTRSALETEIQTETRRQAELKALTDERAGAEARLAHTRDLVAALTSLRARQTLPPQLLDEVQASLPPETRLDEITLSGNVVRISGSADDKEKGTLLALALERLHDTFADVTPQTDTRVDKEADAANGSDALRMSYTFVITAQYTRNARSAAEQKVLEPVVRKES